MTLPKIVSIGVYSFQKAHPKIKVSKKRRTEMFEIELPVCNGGTSFIDETMWQIMPNTVICAKPGQIRNTMAPYECYYIHMIVSDDSMRDVLMNIPNHTVVENPEYYQKIFTDLTSYYDTAVTQDEIILHSRILELIHSLSHEARAASNSVHNGGFKSVEIEKSLQYIQENLTEKLTLRKMAEVMSFSPVYFHNCFQTAVGKTLREYVEEQRIKRAAHLLITTEMTLTAIAYKCGFSSQSYFILVFKRRMGITPRQYVKKHLIRYETNTKK